MAYSLALVVGTLWPYRQTEHRDYEKFLDQYMDDDVPTIRLLFTCRLIHDEAEPLLYAKNRVRLPVSALTERFFTRSLHNAQRCLWVKDVFLSFTFADLTADGD